MKDAKAVADFPPSPQFRVGLNEVTSHLMTDPKGNSEFNFPQTLNVSRGKAEGNMRSRGKQNSLFPAGQSLSVLLYQLKTRKNCEEIVFSTPAGSQICHGFKEPDLITCESKVHVVVSLWSS